MLRFDSTLWQPSASPSASAPLSYGLFWCVGQTKTLLYLPHWARQGRTHLAGAVFCLPLYFVTGVRRCADMEVYAKQGKELTGRGNAGGASVCKSYSCDISLGIKVAV